MKFLWDTRMTNKRLCVSCSPLWTSSSLPMLFLMFSSSLHLSFPLLLPHDRATTHTCCFLPFHFYSSSHIRYH